MEEEGWGTLLDEVEEVWGKGSEGEGLVKPKNYHPKIYSDSSSIKEGVGSEEGVDQWEVDLVDRLVVEEGFSFMVQVEFECRREEEVNREDLVNLKRNRTRLRLYCRSPRYYCSSSSASLRNCRICLGKVRSQILNLVLNKLLDSLYVRALSVSQYLFATDISTSLSSYNKKPTPFMSPITSTLPNSPLTHSTLPTSERTHP